MDCIGEGMNPKWLENKILEMAQDLKDLKEIMKIVSNQTQEKEHMMVMPPKATKYPINKGK